MNYMTIILMILTFFNYSKAQQMGCDSTCFPVNPSMVDSTSINKINTSSTTYNAGTLSYGSMCGSSAGSVLPSAPTTSLCSTGTASPVTTSNVDGETIYSWTCSNSSGTQNCSAVLREIGSCGTDNGKTLTSEPTNLCATGEATNYSLIGSLYSWNCTGNYGSPASCSANLYSDLIVPINSIQVHKVGFASSGGKPASAGFKFIVNPDGTWLVQLLGAGGGSMIISPSGSAKSGIWITPPSVVADWQVYFEDSVGYDSTIDSATASVSHDNQASSYTSISMTKTLSVMAFADGHTADSDAGSAETTGTVRVYIKNIKTGTSLKIADFYYGLTADGT